MVKHINSTYTITFYSRALEVALHRCNCQQSSLRLCGQGKISRQERATRFLLAYPDISTNAITISKMTISLRCAPTQSRGRSSWIYTLTIYTRAQQSYTYAHASALVHAHIDVRIWAISRNDAIILRARERASERAVAFMLPGSRMGENIIRRKARQGKLAIDNRK